MDPLTLLVRRWAVDWLSSHDPAACELILEPDYMLHIGGLTLRGREEYVQATMGQLSLFPGLMVTVHDVISSGERAAIRFTEHGSSTRHDGRPAAWTGIALHEWSGNRLTATYAEEDYLSRKRQLDVGSCDPIQAPAPAPWDAPAVGADPEAEAVVRAWLRQGRLTNVGETSDDRPGEPARPLLETHAVETDALFSAGNRVAFHAVQRGHYLGGLDGTDAAVGTPASLALAGMVTVQDGKIVTGRLVRDRLGTQRALNAATSSRPG